MRNGPRPVRLVITDKLERWGCPVRRCYLEAACRVFAVRKGTEFEEPVGMERKLFCCFMFILLVVYYCSMFGVGQGSPMDGPLNGWNAQWMERSVD